MRRGREPRLFMCGSQSLSMDPAGKKTAIFHAKDDQPVPASSNNPASPQPLDGRPIVTELAQDRVRLLAESRRRASDRKAVAIESDGVAHRLIRADLRKVDGCDQSAGGR